MSRTDEAEIPFADGNITGAVRLGATVRRRVGAWTSGTHPLLRHLEAVGFPAAPRLLGTDEQGREVLTYIDGTTDPDPRLSFGTEADLTAVAGLLRRYHDATRSFVAPADAAWQRQVGAPQGGEVICHNDIAPWNTVVADGQIAAFIDWDFAAPGPRQWDIAHAVWRFVPLYDDPVFGTPVEQGRRLRRFCDAYGLTERAELPMLISRRQAALYDTIAARAAAGEPAYLALWQHGHAAAILNDSRYLHHHWSVFTSALT